MKKVLQVSNKLVALPCTKRNDMSTEFKNFKVLGYTTDFNTCECCGKTNLKGTVSIMDLNFEVVGHYGTTCAASIDKYDSLEAARKAKKDIDSAVRDFNNTIKAARGFAYRLLSRKYGTTGTPKFQVLAPAEVIASTMTSFEKWYTNPENKGKAHPDCIKRN